MLLQMNDDALGVVVRKLCDPLRPLLAVNLGSTAKGLRVPMQAALAQLKHQHQEVAAFVAGMKRGFGDLGPVGIEELNGLTVFDTVQDEFTLAHWKASARSSPAARCRCSILSQSKCAATTRHYAC